jgi:hypothetical protein
LKPKRGPIQKVVAYFRQVLPVATPSVRSRRNASVYHHVQDTDSRIYVQIQFIAAQSYAPECGGQMA